MRAMTTGVMFWVLAASLSYCEDFSPWASTYLGERVEFYNLVGATAAVSVDGEIVWTDGAGYADLENKISATAKMVHRIASITKSMTATAVMQLVAEGKIDLDASLQTYLPDFPEQKKGVIRIHHLLTHTSGIRHYFGRENRPMDHYETFADALELFKHDRIPFEPGTRYRYTTYGYTILGAVMEAVSGMTYLEYMRTKIWKPAGMQSTSLEIKGEHVDNKSKLYRRDADTNNVPDQMTDLSVKYPGGGVQSTAADLVRFAIAFENGTLLDAEHKEMMFHAPDVPRRRFNYGYGWIYDTHPELGRFIENDGGQAGTSTYLLILRDHNIAVAVIANLYAVGGEVRRIGTDLAAKALELRADQSP